MGKKGAEKKPRAAFQPPSGKTVRGGRIADNVAGLPFKWSADSLDWDGPFGWRGLTAEKIFDLIIHKLKQFETMTWGEVEGATGSHFVDVTAIVKEARKRLPVIGMGDTDQLFSLRLGGKPRIWGVRDAAVFRMLWWDPDMKFVPQ